jgi:UDP-glucose 4-epimerase
MDLAAAHLAALEATGPDDPRTDAPLVANLGSGDGTSVKEALAAAERVVGRPAPHRVEPRREGDPPILVASISRAAEVLGWRPVHSTIGEMIGSAWAFRNGAGRLVGA